MCLLTVIMPVYNASEYLSESIESILNQSFKDFTLLILNDNSTDNSLDIINEYAIKDKRVIVTNFDKNNGPAFLRNYGIQNADTKYIALMDADDVSMVNRFEKQINVLNQNDEIGVCGSWFTIFGNIESRIVKHFENHDEIKVNFLNECYIGNPTIMLRKKVVEGFYFDKMFHPMDDYELWSKLIYKTKFHNIPEVLLNYRWHDKNISHTASANLSAIHKTIRYNQLSNLKITNINDNLDYLYALSYESNQSLKTIIKIFYAANTLFKNNNELKVYSKKYFNKLIEENLTKIILEKRKYCIKLLYIVLTKHPIIFQNLTFKQKRRFIKRCLF